MQETARKCIRPCGSKRAGVKALRMTGVNAIGMAGVNAIGMADVKALGIAGVKALQAACVKAHGTDAEERSVECATRSICVALRTCNRG